MDRGMKSQNKRSTPLGTLLLVTLIAHWLCGCGGHQSDQTQDGDATEVDVPSRDINAVLDAHDEELMEIPGVVGVAVGELEDHTPALLVLVVEETEEIKLRVPKSIEGYPVKIMVTGEIRPLDSD